MPLPRPLRIQYGGAIYRPMNRGDRREPIFLDDQDRRTFLRTLQTACDYVHLNPVRAGLVAAEQPLSAFRCSNGSAHAWRWVAPATCRTCWRSPNPHISHPVGAHGGQTSQEDRYAG